MKKITISLIFVIMFSLLLVGCNNNTANGPEGNNPGMGGPHPGPGFGPGPAPGSDFIVNDETSYGEDLKDIGAYDGLFEGDLKDVNVKCVSGTNGAYKLEGNVLTFTNITSESIYSISGKFSGRIVIDVGDSYKFDLEFSGFSLTCDNANPITILSGDEVSIQAKKDTKNYIYDLRAAIDENDATLHSGAIHSEVDLEIAGKGSLTVISENNNGIHSKKDLQVKNLSLTVSCKDNALKGNDSVELENATATLIATVGDGIKTSNSDISNKGNQRGKISFLGGMYSIFAACDGVDASYDVIVDGDAAINIYTDKYSNYSENVISISDTYYIRSTEVEYKYSVKYYNSDSDYLWVNAEYHSKVFGGRYNYYFYTFPKNDAYQKMQIYIYSENMQQSQDKSFVSSSEYITPSPAYDTVAIKLRGDVFSYDLSNFSTNVSGGPGGMNGGNNDKGNHSTKGIKASNIITVASGIINIKSYDDAMHANNDTVLENGKSPLGNVVISGGQITVFTNDDGIYADGTVRIFGGAVNIVNSYEGIEGFNVKVVGGDIKVVSRDDGVNASADSGVGISMESGSLYVLSGGDGMDSNSKTINNGIVFKGGKTLIISNSGGNSAIDTERGYSYTGGSVVAIMPRGGMSGESTNCSSFSSIGTKIELSINKGENLVCNMGSTSLTLNLPVSMQATVVALGSNSASISTVSSSNHNLKNGEFVWE